MDRSPLDLDQATMQRLGYRVTDIIADHLANIGDEPAVNPLPRAQLSRMLAIPAPLHGIEFETLVATLRDCVFPYHARERIPGFSRTCRAARHFPSLAPALRSRVAKATRPFWHR